MKYLSGIPNNLKQSLSGKLATLLAILCGQRAREILAVIVLKNICFMKDVVIILNGDLLKSSTQKVHLGEIKFPTYHYKTICPISFEILYRFDKGHKRRSHRFIYYYNKATPPGFYGHIVRMGKRNAKRARH